MKTLNLTIRPGDGMPLEAAVLALAAVAVFLVSIVCLEFVQGRWDSWRAARKVMRADAAEAEADRAGREPPRPAGRY